MAVIEKRHLKCPHCSYEWDTKSKRFYTACPNCMYKVNIGKHQSQILNMEHFNLDENGVRILDKSLASQNSPRGRIVDIYFKEKRAWCEYDDSQDCKHVEYALSLPIVQELLKKKGWKL